MLYNISHVAYKVHSVIPHVHARDSSGANVLIFKKIDKNKFDKNIVKQFVPHGLICGCHTTNLNFG